MLNVLGDIPKLTNRYKYKGLIITIKSLGDSYIIELDKISSKIGGVKNKKDCDSNNYL